MPRFTEPENGEAGVGATSKSTPGSQCLKNI